jgi:tetratricopeptide (TPR) repeat protein
MTWHLSYPKNATQDSLIEWAEKQIEQGVPRQVISLYFLECVSQTMSVTEMKILLNSESRLSDVMLERNFKGRNLEKAGNVEEAIKLYEANVNDWFSGNFPYDRLKVIYSKQKKYWEAIRVCKAFVRVADYLSEKRSERSDLSPKRNKFIQWIKELEQK